MEDVDKPLKSDRVLVDSIRAAWHPESLPTLTDEVRRVYKDRLTAINERENYLLATFGHMDGNELSAFVEALLQQGQKTTDHSSLEVLRALAQSGREAAILLASVQTITDWQQMYAIVSREYDRAAQHFTQRLEGRRVDHNHALAPNSSADQPAAGIDQPNVESTA